jgi:hypothetical protein
MSDTYGNSFLLKYFDKLTSNWVNKYSLFAIPPLRLSVHNSPELQQRNRDIFIVLMLTGSIMAVVFCYFIKPASPCIGIQLTAAFAFYRWLDLFITISRTGVFLSFRGDIQINKEPSWRVRRVILGVIFNYIELIMWFTIIYFQIALTSKCQFYEEITQIHQALNLSFSTMTTVGYGKYGPNQMLSTILTFLQALTGIILLTLVIGALLALLTRDNKKLSAAQNTNPKEHPTWIKPICTFIPVWIMFYLFLGSSLY